MLNLILFGAPGSGKGTQAVSLAEKYELLHISTGDLFRYEMSNNTPLGQEAKAYMQKGALVPDSVTIGMLKNKILANPQAKGFILDGFPRTLAQAQALDAFLKEQGTVVHLLLALEVPDQELEVRLLERGKESSRADDQNIEIIRNRIEVYKRETQPVADYYGQQDKTKIIEGTGSIEEVLGRLCQTIDQASVFS